VSDNFQSTSRLSAITNDQPVYMTRQVGALICGVHDHTFEKYAKPSAWRRDRHGKLTPLYSDQDVKNFRAMWTPERVDAEMRRQDGQR
jgi:hypothetical protein